MKKVALGSIAKFINGMAFKPSDWEDEGLPIIRIQNLTGSTNIINFFSGHVDPKYHVFDGDILISWSASLGVYIWSGGDAVLNQHIFRVELKDEVVDKVYFYYSVSNALEEMQARVHGTTMQHITRDPFLAIEIPLPSLPEQQHIAAILSKADRLRRLRHTARQIGATYLQSVFLEMFGDPATNPMGWEVKNMGSQINSIRYGTGSPPGDYLVDGFPFIRATNIKGGTIVENDMAYISEVAAKGIEKCQIKDGNLLIVRSGINTGDCALVPRKFDRAYAAYDLIVDINFPINIFYNVLINSVHGKAVIGPLSRRAGQAHLNTEQVKSLTFPFPPILLQEKFAQLALRHGKLIQQQREAERQAEHLFQSLLKRAFEGELYSE